MGVKLESKRRKGVINVSELKDGQIAEIISWIYSEYIGIIVQRYQDSLVSIGESSGDSWESIYKSHLFNEVCVVRILDEGEMLIITNNG